MELRNEYHRMEQSMKLYSENKGQSQLKNFYQFYCFYLKASKRFHEEKAANHNEFNKEKDMLDVFTLRYVILDIIISHEYTVSGIASDIFEPSEVVEDLASGVNTNPSLTLAAKIIELHRKLKPDLYQELSEKLNSQKKPQENQIRTCN